MPRARRRDAGARVAASAERFSDETLALEEEAFARIAGVYDELARDVATELRQARSVAPSSDVWVLIAVMLAAAEAEAATIVDDLLAATIAAAIAAVAIELGAVEDTLAADAEGIAALAVSTLDAQEQVENARERARSELARVTAAAQEDVTRVAREVHARGGDRDELIDRLTGTDVRRPGQSGRGIVRRPATPAQQAARAVSIESDNQTRETAMQAFNDELEARGRQPVIYKQVMAKIDSRTTVVCLHAAGQSRPLDEPFDTLNGLLDRPPFHWGCRSTVIPWAPGFGRVQRDRANRELQRRPPEKRVARPGGALGPRLSLPPIDPPAPLPPELAADPKLPLAKVPLEHRIAYFRAHPARFAVQPNGPASWWLVDGDRRLNLRR